MVCQSAEEIKMLLTVAQKYKDDKAQSRADQMRRNDPTCAKTENSEHSQAKRNGTNGNVLHTLQQKLYEKSGSNNNF